MKGKGLLVAVPIAALVAACSTTTAGVATAPSDLTTTRTKTTGTTAPAPSSTAPPTSSSGLPPEAYDAVRAAGIDGPDSAIDDQVSMACIMAASSFNHSKQDVVNVLLQMGSKLPQDALMTIVTVALKYECPEYSSKLGG
jgi:hypothetical protein